MNSLEIPPQSERSSISPRVLCGLVILISAVVMGRLATHDFVDWDDRFLLANNPKFNPPTWASVLGYVLPKNVDENLYIPATQLFWGFLAAIGHTDHADATGSMLNPWVFHGANVVLHLACVGVVFAILCEFIPSIPACFGALVFAIHPLQVETIAWAGGLRDLLSALFGFVCLYEFIRYRRAKQYRCYVFATVAFLLAMLSKPSAVALPLEALVIDLILLRTQLRMSLASLVVWFCLTIPIILITRHVQPMLWSIDSPLIMRPVIALDAIAFYCAKVMLPIHLALDYGRSPRMVLASGWQTIWIIPILAGVFLFWKRKSLPLAIAACLLALAGLVPVLGFVPFGAQDYSTVSNHYVYPSMLGIAIVAAILFDTSWRRLGRWGTTSVATATIIALSWQSFSIGDVWSNSYSLFAKTLSVNPRSSYAHAGLGNALAESGDFSGAIEEFRSAIALNPHNGMAMMGLANSLLHQGDMDGAATQYENLMAIYQMQSNFDPKLGAAGEIVVAARLMKRGESARAVAALEQAHRWDPQNQKINDWLAQVHRSAASSPR